jgi:hypothetical protein
MFMKDNILLLAETWAREFMPAHLTVHDSLCLDVPESRADEARELLKSILTREIPQLQGLRIGAEVEVGRNWASFDAKKNPEGMKSVEVVNVQ